MSTLPPQHPTSTTNGSEPALASPPVMGSSSSKAATMIRKYKSFLIVLPYLVGVVWACLHSTSSILTGDFAKPRGWYIDENSLETTNLRSDYRYHSTAAKSCDINNSNNIYPANASLCEFVNDMFADKDAITCHRHQQAMDMVRVVPVANTFEPSNEAIVLVAPHPVSSSLSGGNETWITEPFHVSLLDLIRRLSSAKAVPWMAKTIFLVSPTSPDILLEDVVHFFLESYMGTTHEGMNLFYQIGATITVEPLPLGMSDAMIRNLLVLDSQPSVDPTQSKDEIRILPQGKRGILPNMDLVFTAMSVFSRTPMSGAKRKTTESGKTPTLRMHPYGEEARQWENWVQTKLIEPYKMSKPVEKWAIQLGNLVLFCRHLFQGPHSPHAPALERGIDAITIQGRYVAEQPAQDVTSFIANYVHKLEVTLHGLSNLHERLHHSTPLYLLPSPTTFVKHEEYLVPNLLLLIPIVLRAAFLGLEDIRRFDLAVMGWLLVVTVVGTVLMDIFVAHQEPVPRNTLWCLLYAVCGAVLYEKVIRNRVPTTQQDYTNAMRSVQLIISLMTVYLHVPICFQNVSLSYPSAAFWAPCVAFPAFGEFYQSTFGILAFAIWLILSWPPTVLLSSVFADSCPVYIRFLYFPLHLALSLAFFLGLLLRPTKR